MADPDITIPVAYATTVSPVTTVQPIAPFAKGTTSRVILPSEKKSKEVTENEIRALQEQGFTTGLAEALSKNNTAFPLRIWVVDNSGSMAKSDGHRMIETIKKDDVKVVTCTRWAEIQETVDYHAQMAALLQAPTVFRLLNDPGRVNGPQQFGVAERGEEFLEEDLEIARKTMRQSTPGGVTPLAAHVREIGDNIRSMEPSLVQSGTRVAVILATDGLPTNANGIFDQATKQDFLNALRGLEGLPVWVVIRLCTDQDDVVEFYNELDSQLEMSLEVLDDFIGEANELYEHNKYLNYALPIHRCREMGYHNRIFDLVDERPLTKDELRDLFVLLFGAGKLDGLPDAQVDWSGFVKGLTNIVESEKPQWNPVTKKVQPWVDIKKLNKAYKKKSCTIM